MPDGTVVATIASAIIGGAVGASIKFLSDEFGYMRNESREANKKLYMYAKPLWRSCQELKIRLDLIYMRQTRREFEQLEALKWSPNDSSASCLSWYNKDGQFVISTAYLISVVSSWIVLLQRDIGFLRFGKKSDTTNFYILVEQFKSSIADYDSILYYNFFDGIGAKLILDSAKRPMSIDEFSEATFKNQLFRDYFEQLYNFLHEVACGKFSIHLKNCITALDHIMEFLVKNGAIPEIGRIVLDQEPQDFEGVVPSEDNLRPIRASDRIMVNSRLR